MKSKTQFIDLSADQASLLRGRRYNRTKKSRGGDGSNQHKQMAHFEPIATDANQLGRRNLSADQASLLRGRRYNRTKKAAHGRADRNFWGVQNAPPKTADRLAAQHGVSRDTIKRDGAFATAVENVKAADPEIERKVIE